MTFLWSLCSVSVRVSNLIANITIGDNRQLLILYGNSDEQLTETRLTAGRV
jgi:hypothetical protein